MPCDPCVHTRTHELPRQALAQHLFNIYFYIMSIPMHQQCQTQLRISNANSNNSNKFVHAHKGRRKHIPLAHKTISYIKRKFKQFKQIHPCTPGASRMSSRGRRSPGSWFTFGLRAVGAVGAGCADGGAALSTDGQTVGGPSRRIIVAP